MHGFAVKNGYAFGPNGRLVGSDAGSGGEQGGDTTTRRRDVDPVDDAVFSGQSTRTRISGRVQRSGARRPARARNLWTWRMCVSAFVSAFLQSVTVHDRGTGSSLARVSDYFT